MLSLIERFKEPSSWAGIAGIATPILAVFGLTVDPGIWTYLAYIGAGIAGVLAIVLPERAT
jgi:hypothetical protein